jgi:hypothetical protein
MSPSRSSDRPSCVGRLDATSSGRRDVAFDDPQAAAARAAAFSALRRMVAAGEGPPGPIRRRAAPPIATMPPRWASTRWQAS